MNFNFTNPITGRVIDPFYQSPPIHQDQSLSSSPAPSSSGSGSGSTEPPIELEHVSYEGAAEYAGITEFADLSDLPRKYLQLVANNAAGRREITTPFSRLGFSTVNRTVYNTAGTRTEQISAWAALSSGAPYGSGSGVSLDVPGDSQESADWSAFAAPWTNSQPTWQRDRTKKWFTMADFSTPTTDIDREEFGMGVGRSGGNVGTIRGLGVSPAWNGAGWTLTLFPYNDESSAERRIYARIRNGDRDPGTVTTSDFLVGVTSTQYPSVTLHVPPGSSVRFLVIRGGATPNGIQVPQQIDTTITNGDEGASGLTVDAYDRWFHFAETEEAQPEWRFEESLCNEDTLTNAILRGVEGVDYVVGTNPVATTTALSGGTTAESNDNIDWEGRVVRSTQTHTGLTVGHRYSVTAHVRSNTIGDTDYVFTDETGEEFVASSDTEAITHEVRAALGKDKRLISISIADLGADPAEPTDYDTDTMVWWGKVAAQGGTLESDSLDIADDTILALKAASVWTKIVYMLPLLGADVTAALVPLRDSAFAGLPTNNNFVDGDFSQATGLQGDESTKYLVIPRMPNELGSSNNGGLFWWELGFSALFTNVEPMGTYNNAATRRYCFDLRSTIRGFRWGTPGADQALENVSADNAFFHGERRSTTDRELYRNGASIVSDAGADSVSGIGDNEIIAWGCDNGSSISKWGGLGGVAGCTNGTLSDADALALYEALRDNLMIPTGRVAP